MDGNEHAFPQISPLSMNCIAGSNHKPPKYFQVHDYDYMEELIRFIAQPNFPKNDWFKTATAHHRFIRILPFDNGKGGAFVCLRSAGRRGVEVDAGRMLNSTAVFAVTETSILDDLPAADFRDEPDMTAWSEYVLSGLKQEMEKIDRLMDYPCLKQDVIMPAIVRLRDRKMLRSEKEDA